MIFHRFENIKFIYKNRKFQFRGYYADTADKNVNSVKEYKPVKA